VRSMTKSVLRGCARLKAYHIRPELDFPFFLVGRCKLEDFEVVRNLPEKKSVPVLNFGGLVSICLCCHISYR